MLGPVSVLRDGTAAVPRSRHQATLLAGLLLADGAPVSGEVLAGWLWGDDRPAEEKAALQVAVSRLRKWLGDRGEIRLSAAGYSLDVTGARVDLREFRRCVTQARHAKEGGLYRQALACWRGRLLADISGELRESAQAVAIGREYRQAVREFAELAPAEATPMLEAIAAEDPYAEDVHASLARAYAATGGQAEAIAVLDRIRKRLADELGVDPGEALATAQLEILRGEVVAPPERAHTWWGIRPRPIPLLGREKPNLADYLAAERLVTITGPTGVGKTALAWQAESTGNGAVVELGGATDRVTALAELGTVFAVGTDDSDGVLPEVAKTIGQAPTLLILDGCERVLPVAAEITHHLLRACAGLRVLATSQQALGLDGEQVLILDPLPVPTRFDEGNPSIALFLRRVRATSPELALTAGEREAIASICARLDGLPLAVELAAGWVRSLGVEELARRLTTLLAKANTLNAAISWSFDALPQPGPLTRLAIFDGPFTLADAERVCGLDADDLADLVARSLVHPLATTPLRYRVLAPVREHARKALSDSGELVTVLERHLDRWREVFAGIDSLESTWDRGEAMAALVVDAPRLHSALAMADEHGLAVRAAGIVALCAEFWWSHAALLPASRPFFDAAWRVLDECSAETAALLRFHRAWLTRLDGDYAGALAEMQAVKPSLRPREYLTAQSFALTTRRYMLRPDVLDDCEAVVAEVSRLDAEGGGETSTALTAAGWVFATWGRWTEARTLCQRYELRNGRLHKPTSMPQLVLRAEIALGRGDATAAARWLALVKGRLDPASDPVEQEPAHAVLAKALLIEGRAAEAVEFLSESVAALTAAYPRTQRRSAQLTILLAEAHRALGHLDDARAALTVALSTVADYQSAFSGVLVAANLAAADGDLDLGARWTAKRLALGLPDPTGFAPLSVEVPEAEPGDLDELIESAYLASAMLI
ncbi:Predicted ATPase [Amycolatopsis xylanica]|uniref:Predicted ATPase n=1 Tax=Amycolatopsis xylanica TaxID=589385 RepID=A0A1H3S860_9PSEU|nr:Predicted ATPase [Amycolatopsis xylanica]